MASSKNQIRKSLRYGNGQAYFDHLYELLDRGAEAALRYAIGDQLNRAAPDWKPVLNMSRDFMRYCRERGARDVMHASDVNEARRRAKNNEWAAEWLIRQGANSLRVNREQWAKRKTA